MKYHKKVIVVLVGLLHEVQVEYDVHDGLKYEVSQKKVILFFVGDLQVAN